MRMSHALLERTRKIKRTSAPPRIMTALRVLLLMRFSIILAALGVFVFWFVDQGQEILEQMNAGRGIWFAIAAFVCGASAWYSGRIMYRFDLDERVIGNDEIDREEARKLPEQRLLWLRRNVPRLVGTLMPVSLLACAIIARSSYGWVGILLTAASLILAFLVWKRRSLRRWALRTARAVEEEPRRPVLDDMSLRQSWSHLTSPEKAYLIASLGLWAVLVGVFAFPSVNVPLSQTIGAGAVVLVGLAVLIPVGSILVYVGSLKQFPLLTLVILVALVWSGIGGNDNHGVRLLPPDTPDPFVSAAGPEASTTLPGYYQAWLDARLEESPPDEPVPVYVVNAEGGGIRAAYWTAAVLSELQARSGGRFARHVFAVSGVSGGSVGASLFAALAADSTDAGSWRRSVRSVLSRDFLSPTLAALLFPDFVQQFWAGRLCPDRAAALEVSWERAWKDVMGTDALARPMESLWRERPVEVPLLFLNTTVVESGDRLIVQPLPLSKESFESTFKESLDGRRVFSGSPRLSTAASLSARFTYVSPAATVERADLGGVDDRWIRLVDGGYFENSAAITGQEIVEAVGLADDPRVRFVLIHIMNYPQEDVVRQDPSRGRKRRYANEVLAPIQALLRTREARGYHARSRLWQDLGADEPGSAQARQCVRFWLKGEEKDYPLGWLLSEHTLDAMDEQVASRLREDIEWTLGSLFVP